MKRSHSWVLHGLIIFFSVSPARAQLLISTVAPSRDPIIHSEVSLFSVSRKRPFTVQDSIEMWHIIDPAGSTVIGLREELPVGVPLFSPNRRYFLLVSQRGVLATNNLEATIWLFDVEKVREYMQGNSRTRPEPRKLANVTARSNTPVISDVRWVDDSTRITFLAKNSGPYQRVFIADVPSGSLRALTQANLYVTAYQMRGGTIAYAALNLEGYASGFKEEMIDVGHRSISELLYHDPVPSTEDLTEDFLVRLRNTLHVQKAGKEIQINYVFQSKPLQLFAPTLSISPDEETVITVAAVQEVPKEWEQYQSRFEWTRLKSGPVQENSLGTFESFWRPEQYVTVNLKTGSVMPLVDAPAGRGMGYYVPAEAYWFEDSHNAIVTNTFLPPGTTNPSMKEIYKHAMVAAVDLSTRSVHAITSLQITEGVETVFAWDVRKREFTQRYVKDGAADIVVPASQTFGIRSGEWVKSQELYPSGDELNEKMELSVRQDLNDPPMLWARTHSNTEVVLWDPNPQFKELKLGKASIYRWHDAKGRAWSGILVLPDDQNTTRRYPLVIQTHGYRADAFFADGFATTGYGGRALTAKDIVVLQMDESGSRAATPEEAPDNLDGFESGVGQLVADGVVDSARVGVIGFSRTCFWVRFALMHRPDLFSAATINDGFNPGYMSYLLHRSGDEYQREMEAINEGIPFGDGLLRWIHNAADFNLDKIRAPLLISSWEKGELLSEWETYAGLRRLNKPVEMLWWWKENTPHILVQPTQRYLSQQSAVDWFDFWLNDHEDPDPAKAEQYTRWRQLRKLQQTNNAGQKPN